MTWPSHEPKPANPDPHAESLMNEARAIRSAQSARDQADAATAVDSSRLTFSSASVWALILLFGSLLGLATAGAWRAANAFGEIKAAFAANEREHAEILGSLWTRVEASQYHHDLEKSLQRAGVKVDFPPPVDPIIRRTN